MSGIPERYYWLQQRSRLESKHGTAITVRALIDQGISINLITERTAQQLRAPKQKWTMNIITAGNNSTVKTNYKVNLKVSSQQYEFSTQIEALVIQSITDVTSSASQGSRLRLATPTRLRLGWKNRSPYRRRNIRPIIQQGFIKGPTNTPIAQLTHIGWVLSGGIADEHPPQCFRITTESDDSTAGIDDRLRSLWEVVQLTEIPILKPEDKRVMEHFASTNIIDSDGRFMIRLPFKSNLRADNFLGSSYHTCD